MATDFKYLQKYFQKGIAVSAKSVSIAPKMEL
jgi:hypothetical protein